MCVFSAFNHGLLYQQFSLDNTLVGQNQLFDLEEVNSFFEEGIELAEEVCQVGQVLNEYNMFRAKPLDQLETVIKTLSQQR